MKFGLETEYRLILQIPPAVRFSRKKFWLKFFDILDNEFLTVKGLTSGSDYDNTYIRFLSNGGKLYLDFSPEAHRYEAMEALMVEYATPECATVEELIAHDMAGLELICHILKETFLFFKNYDLYLSLFKINRDTVGNLSGCHENYEISPRLYQILSDPEHPLVDRFWIPFIVSRILLGGNGWYEGNQDYRLSQRADFIKFYLKNCENCHPLKLKERGVIDTRDEHFGTTKRLHLLIGDSNITTHSLRHKVSSTILVLTFLENMLLCGEDYYEILLPYTKSLGDFQKLNQFNEENLTVLRNIQLDILERINSVLIFEHRHLYQEWERFFAEKGWYATDWSVKWENLNKASDEKRRCELNRIYHRVYDSQHQMASWVPRLNQWESYIMNPPNTPSAKWRSAIINEKPIHPVSSISWHAVLRTEMEDGLIFRDDIPPKERLITKIKFLGYKLRQGFTIFNRAQLEEKLKTYLDQIDDECLKLELLWNSVGLSQEMYWRYITQCIEKKHNTYHQITEYSDYITAELIHYKYQTEEKIVTAWQRILEKKSKLDQDVLKKDACEYVLRNFAMIIYECLNHRLSVNKLLPFMNKFDTFPEVYGLLKIATEIDPRLNLHKFDEIEMPTVIVTTEPSPQPSKSTETISNKIINFFSERRVPHSFREYRTIEDAIQHSLPGTQILIQAGRYEGELVLDKPLKLIKNEGDEVVIVGNKSKCATISAHYAYIQDLTFEGKNSHKSQYTVEITNGKVLFDSCRIMSDHAGGLAILEPTATPIIRHCQIHQCQDRGIYIFKGGRGLIEDCEIHHNKSTGIEARMDADPVIRNCKIYENQGAGIHMLERAQGLIETCDIFSNRKPGIAISENAQPVIRKCNVYDGQDGGIYIYDKGRGKIEECEVYNNAAAGVALNRGGHPTISHCKIYRGLDVGIEVFEKSRGIIQECDIYENAGAGIKIARNGMPVIRNCWIHHGKKNGIYITEQGQGQVKNCDIYENNDMGVEIVQGDNPHFSDCNIYQNNGDGISISNETRSYVMMCRIYQNRTGGIRIFRASDPTIRQCKIYHNKNDGILIYDAAKGSVIECDIYHNERAGISVEAGGNPFIQLCRVYEEKVGIVVFNKGLGAVEECDIINNVIGLGIVTEGQPTIRSCRINKNQQVGIKVINEGKGIVQDCDLRGNIRSTWQIDRDSSLELKNNIT